MATTVNAAFAEFLRDSVNLDPEQTANARSSRDWLLGRINAIPGNDSGFPLLHPDRHINFGSFARRTKKRPLDDLDMMVCLHAQGSHYHEEPHRITIATEPNAPQLKAFCFDNSNLLNSRKVVNKLVAALSEVPQYEQSEIHRNDVAARLELSSYDWNFDIVPCFFTVPEHDGSTYYLIPDGSGYWQKTDPRKDRTRAQEINQSNDGNVLNVIRAMKYWNKRPTMPSMSSYLLENMVLDRYESGDATAGPHVDIEIINTLAYIKHAIYRGVMDPKGIQGDINSLELEERERISNRAQYDHERAYEAYGLETQQGDHRASIRKWGEIFGDAFPTYG